jgi:hypothetical protein
LHFLETGAWKKAMADRKAMIDAGPEIMTPIVEEPEREEWGLYEQ